MKLKQVLRLKTFLVLFLLGILVGSVAYFNLSSRHQALLKTRFLHTFRIIDHEWEISIGENEFRLASPELLVDDIYQSMDGPQAFIYLDINPNTSKMKWIAGFKAEVIQDGTKKHNNDLLCHTNIDYYDAIHYKNLKIPKRINSSYPRLGTLSNGTNELYFPEGFGFPVANDDKFIVASRTLNHNIKDAFFKVKHYIDFKTQDGNTPLKPLIPKALVMLQNYDKENPNNPDLSKDPNLCTPIDLKIHTYEDDKGVLLSSHWVLPNGQQQYEYEVTYQLGLEEDTRIHAMAAHLHPHSQSFSLYDMTAQKHLYTFECENYDDKIGLKNVPTYSSAEGIALYADHKYKIILITNHSQQESRDMMAVLYAYVYDREMDEHLRSSNFLGVTN